MSDAISSILSQIRTLQSQSHGLAAPVTGGHGSPGSIGGVPAGETVSFSDTLKDALGKVSASQLETGRLRSAFEMGDQKVDLTRVMLSSMESQLQFKAVVEVRNRLVQAYQDVMNMPV